MSRGMAFATCGAIVVLVARIGFCANVEIVPKEPQGFRFGNGRLLPWGFSKDTLIAMLPPQPLRADVAKINEDSYERCEASLREVQKVTGTASPDTCGDVLDARAHRVVWCSNQQPPLSDSTDADSLVAGEGKEMVNRVAAGDGCVVSAEALPIPYYGLALLAFNRDRFFRVNVEFASKDFDDIERSLCGTLGKPKRRTVGAAQNGFGASFDTVDDSWRVGPVSVLLSKRIGNIDEGALTLTYTPLAKSAPERPATPPPF